ncbi:unnamed protein product [Rotaria sordida]|uniref:Peptidase C45 hydrolase domain-containing protein n=1 Tax=Rotaria sordida TaxID=392033 RepID=A0A815WD22_9BILA|nr:unnamed protein product [Rotaria sordida]CAF1541949.1 unnamed protein product [Rotaria sordida]
MSVETNNNNYNHQDQRIPFYSIEGTHYECSFKLGQLIAQRIRERIKKESNDLQPLFNFIKTDVGSKYFNSYTATIQDEYPWYYDELKGLSDGSEVSLKQILVLNYKNELKAANDIYEEQEKDERGRSSCSTVLINRLDNYEQLLFIAHNEDEADSNWNTSYILQATVRSSVYRINGKEELRESPNERFIALGYAGQLAGNGFGANHHGFVFTYNGLYPKIPRIKNCLSRQLLNRLVLTVENEQQLDQILKTQLTAYGFNLNVGRFRCSDDIPEKYLLSYEIGPSNENEKTNQCNINYILNEKQVEDTRIIMKHKDILSSSFSLNYYCHFNHYIHLQTVPEEDKPLSSSKMRAKRASEFGDIKISNQALQLLGDEKYKSEHPIYRRASTGQTNTVTLCTALIDFTTSMLYVYDDNPGLKTSSPFFEFDLNSL